MPGKRGYKFFSGPCDKCGKEVALSFTDPGHIWFRRHNPCGSFKTRRSEYETRNKGRIH